MQRERERGVQMRKNTHTSKHFTSSLH
jgi:hypothetical protein